MSVRKRASFFHGFGGDPTTWSLLLANLITISVALRFQWNLLELMWLYWAQSVIIGSFNVVRILRCSAARAKDTAANFVMHYGFFHLIYAFFLVLFTLDGTVFTTQNQAIQWPTLLILILLFLANHAYSFFYNFRKDASKEDPVRLMLFPYARIFPMHLTLIFGGLFTEFFPDLLQVIPLHLLFFLLLKTGADVVMHLIEHK